MKLFLKKLLFTSLLLLVIFQLSGCGETVSGIGKDVRRVGKGVKTIFFRDGK
ncbi:MAG: entericidin [Candidatus Omnitrophica bacterium]|nr:entericidin [Candidatus Omnitrophota bacterium]